MGGCATKPRVLKDDDPSDALAPAPAPAPSTSPRAPPQKEEDTVVKEAVVENDAKDQMEGAVVDHDSATKNSSLGNLFKENQEGKDSGAETVKVPDVSEVTTKEVEKTIPEDSSLKKAEEKKIKEEDAKEKKTAATEEEEEVVGEIAEKKPDEVNVVMAEEKNLDHIKSKVANPDGKKPETQQQQQEQEEKGKKGTDESLKPAIVHPPPPPPAAAADQEKFATPKEKPEETYATTAKEEKKPEPEQIQGEEQQTLKK